MIVHARPDPARGVLFSLLAGLLVALAFVFADCGNIEEAHADPVTPQLALARACAGEASLTVTEDECAAIGAVLARRGPRYSAAFRLCRQPWVCGLEKDARRPAAWPSEWGPWERWRPRFVSLFEFSGRVVDGAARHRCEAPPDHFGSSADAERFLAEHGSRWRVTDCGDTANTFLARR